MSEGAQMQGGVRTGPEHTHVCEDREAQTTTQQMGSATM